MSNHKRYHKDWKSWDEQFIDNYKNSEVVLLKAPMIAQTLKNSMIDCRVRTKMVDWIFEVLWVLNEEISINTFIRTVLLMDVYIKNSKTILKNEDIHLLGLACIYIASKYEDVYHIKIGHLAIKAAHGKYSTVNIRAKEDEILATLGFNISFSSFCDILDHYLIWFFYSGVQTYVEEIRQIVLAYICLCMHDC